MFVLDASVTLSWYFEDESNPYVDGVMDTFDSSEVIVPAIWPLEVANGLLVAERRKRLTSKDADRGVELLVSLPVRVCSPLIRSVFVGVFQEARRQNLSVYDASYLELAMREGVALATVDTRLKKACRRLGVAIYKP